MEYVVADAEVQRKVDVGRRRRIGLGSDFFSFLSYKSLKCNENLPCLHEYCPVYMNFHNSSKIYCRSMKIYGKMIRFCVYKHRRFDPRQS